MNVPLTRTVVRAFIHSEKLRFLLVGAWNTVFGYVAFAVIHLLFGEAIGTFFTLVASYAISLPHAFVTQRFFVFSASGPFVPQFLRFTLANSSIFVSNIVLVPIVVAGAHADPLIVQAVFIALSTVASYLAHKHFSFARRDHE